MKVYEHKPIEFVRVAITRQGDKKGRYVSFIETTIEEVRIELMKIAKETGSVFANEHKRTRVNVRRAVGSKNMESESFSFYGPSPEEFYNSVMESLKSKDNV